MGKSEYCLNDTKVTLNKTAKHFNDTTADNNNDLINIYNKYTGDMKCFIGKLQRKKYSLEELTKELNKCISALLNTNRYSANKKIDR